MFYPRFIYFLRFPVTSGALGLGIRKFLLSPWPVDDEYRFMFYQFFSFKQAGITEYDALVNRVKE